LEFQIQGTSQKRKDVTVFVNLSRPSEKEKRKEKKRKWHQVLVILCKKKKMGNEIASPFKEVLTIFEVGLLAP